MSSATERGQQKNSSKSQQAGWSYVLWIPLGCQPWLKIKKTNENYSNCQFSESILCVITFLRGYFWYHRANFMLCYYGWYLTILIFLILATFDFSLCFVRVGKILLALPTILFEFLNYSQLRVIKSFYSTCRVCNYVFSRLFKL